MTQPLQTSRLERNASLPIQFTDSAHGSTPNLSSREGRITINRRTQLRVRNIFYSHLICLASVSLRQLRGVVIAWSENSPVMTSILLKACCEVKTECWRKAVNEAYRCLLDSGAVKDIEIVVENSDLIGNRMRDSNEGSSNRTYRYCRVYLARASVRAVSQ